MAMLLFSLVPALQAVGSEVAEKPAAVGPHASPRAVRRQWLRSTLATTQMALALALLFASVLALTAADRTVNGALGFDKRNVLVGQMVPLPVRTYEKAEKRQQFADQRDRSTCAPSPRCPTSA